MKLLTLTATLLLALSFPSTAKCQEWIKWKGQSPQSDQVPGPVPVQDASPTPIEQNASPPSIPLVLAPTPTTPAPQVQPKSPSAIVLIPGDISRPYDILGNVEIEVKGRDSESQAKSAIQELAQQTYGQVDAILFYNAEMRVANILAGYALKGGFKWKATGIAVRFK